MTVIHRRHRFVYLKSMKTAGTAVEAHLLTRTPLGGDIWRTASEIKKHGLPMRRRYVVMGSVAGHLVTIPPVTRRYLWRYHIQEHQDAASLSRQLGSFWKGALKATSVRNPWDVMVSGWAWRRDGKAGTAPPITTSFHEWARACLSGDSDWQKRVQAYDPRNLMDPFLFMDGRVAVDVVVRQERIDDGLREIGDRLGLSLPPLTIREKASSRRRDYRSYYTDELAELVGEYFSDIVSHFHYRFDAADD